MNSEIIVFIQYQKNFTIQYHNRKFIGRGEKQKGARYLPLQRPTMRLIFPQFISHFLLWINGTVKEKIYSHHIATSQTQQMYTKFHFNEKKGCVSNRYTQSIKLTHGTFDTDFALFIFLEMGHQNSLLIFTNRWDIRIRFQLL